MVQHLDDFVSRADADAFEAALQGAAAPSPEMAALLGTAHEVASVSVPGPDPAFVAALGQQLRAEAGALVDGSAPAAGTSPTVIPLRRTWPKVLAGAAAGVIVAGTGLGVASQGALPGDALYPVRSAVDGLEVRLASSDGAKGRALLAQAREHVDDAQELAAREDPPAEDIRTALRGAAASIESGEARLFRAFDQTRDPSHLAAVQDFTSWVQPRLSELRTHVPPDALGELATLQSSVDAGSGTLRDKLTACGPACDGVVAPLSQPTATASALPPTSAAPAPSVPVTATTAPGSTVTPSVPATLPGWPTTAPAPLLTPSTPPWTQPATPGPAVPPVPVEPSSTERPGRPTAPRRPERPTPGGRPTESRPDRPTVGPTPRPTGSRPERPTARPTLSRPGRPTARPTEPGQPVPSPTPSTDRPTPPIPAPTAECGPGERLNPEGKCVPDHRRPTAPAPLPPRPTAPGGTDPVGDVTTPKQTSPDAPVEPAPTETTRPSPGVPTDATPGLPSTTPAGTTTPGPTRTPVPEPTTTPGPTRTPGPTGTVPPAPPATPTAEPSPSDTATATLLPTPTTSEPSTPAPTTPVPSTSAPTTPAPTTSAPTAPPTPAPTGQVVVPEAPTFHHRCVPGNALVKVPRVEGLRYDWWRTDLGPVTTAVVTVEALPGYRVADGATTVWLHTWTDCR